MTTEPLTTEQIRNLVAWNPVTCAYDEDRYAAFDGWLADERRSAKEDEREDLLVLARETPHSLVDCIYYSRLGEYVAEQMNAALDAEDGDA